MPSPASQDPGLNARLRLIGSRLDDVDQHISTQLALLTMHGADGIDIIAPLGSKWQPLPGREGVLVYHVFHPDRPGALFVTVSLSAPGSYYTGSRIDESRLVGVLEGEIDFDGQPLGAGQFVWIAPKKATSWRSDQGATCVVRYHAPDPHL